MTTLLPRPGRLTRLGRGLVDQLTWPHGSAGFADAYRPAVGAGRISATVEAITPRSPRANSITLRPHSPIAFAPGQHVLLTTQIDGARQTRCYSLSDTPHRVDGRLEVTVAHLPDGLVSSHLTGPLRVGEAVGLSAPQGHGFVLPRVRPDRLILIGGGSGVTPLRSMWRTMAAEGLADRVTVVVYARTAVDVIFADELTAIGATVITTRSDGSRSAGSPPITWPCWASSRSARRRSCAARPASSTPSPTTGRRWSTRPCSPNRSPLPSPRPSAGAAGGMLTFARLRRQRGQ